jgi:hypothetical protein
MTWRDSGIRNSSLWRRTSLLGSGEAAKTELDVKLAG